VSALVENIPASDTYSGRMSFESRYDTGCSDWCRFHCSQSFRQTPACLLPYITERCAVWATDSVV